ncbi:WYL domain-containing protein [Vibrio genomosp. F6]|uniref:helix-turn-helix transcriptional regulator n=1 Tax=Vibrio genomosp. F6 TaxID=723172 RepID=UPI0010BD40B8|nr:WYL domain-containing protein [Vibrio genomosp. F6]TKF21154.1 WYL domain-containing protein [Vibrio genomosp. F6]
MAKRSSTQESLAFAFELLKRIPRSGKGKVTALELQQQLECIGIQRDIRTVQRNLEMLCEHFDIVKDDRAKPYGYSLKTESEGLALPLMSPQESLLLSLAEDYLQNLLPKNVMASLYGFFKAARNNLSPSEGNTKEREWLKKVRFVSETQPLLPPKVEDQVFSEISKALYHNRWLDIEYTNGKQEDKKSEVMPLGLAQQGSRLYLVCRFKGYNNERSLAVHRINKAVCSTFSFDRPVDFNLSKYDNDGRFGFGEGNQCRVEFCITKKVGFHLLETPLSEDQTVEELDSHYLITATVIDSMQLEHWLRGFGDDIWNVIKIKK